MHPFDLRPILEEHERRRMREAGQERLAAAAALRWTRRVRRLPRSVATSSPLVPACNGGDHRCRGASAPS